jgi:hypothetical protein
MQKTHMANLFGCHILLLCVAHAGGDPPPNQLLLLNNTEHTSNGVANTFSVRETHTAHGRKMHPSFEDFITKLFDLVRRHIFLLALGGPCFAHGCCLSLSLTHPFQEKNDAASCSNICSLSINILILAQPSAAPPDCKKTSVWALALKCTSTVTKIGS